MRRRARRSVGITALVATVLALPLVALVGRASAGAVSAGYVDGSYSGAGSAPTGEKPESKLWWNDGSWWADMWSPTGACFDIYRLDRSTESWTDTQVRLDCRSSSKADALWDGTHLYIASAVFASSSGASTAGNPTRLYRFSYAGGQYTLDSGFPAAINNVSSETITIDKDSRGVLWATWTQLQQVYVSHTSGGDASWITPFVLPVTNANNLETDDISAVAAFGGNKIGVMWSNQATASDAMYLAIHTDGAPDGTWTVARTAVQGPNQADDHINLKQLVGDPSGKLYAAVKTSLDATGSTSAPQIMLDVYDPTSNSWSNSVFGTVADCHTRPLLMLDRENQVLHMFATAPVPGVGCPYSGYPGAIYEKTAPLSNLSFAPGRGTPVIYDSSSANLNNVTGSKQNVDSTTGLVVVAGNDATKYYYHADEAIPAAPASSSSSSTSTSTSTSSSTSTTSTTSSSTSTTTTTTTSTSSSSTSTTPPPPAGISVGSSTSTGQTTATPAVTLTKPSDAVTGDVLVAAFTVDKGTSVSSPPAGWTRIMAPLVNWASATNAYYHVVTDADSSVSSWSWTLSSAQKWGGGITTFSGVDTTTVLESTVPTAKSSGSVTSISLPVSSVPAGDLVVTGLGADGQNSAMTPPSNFTADFLNNSGKMSATAAEGFPSGASGLTLTWSVKSARALSAWAIELRPAPAGL